MVVLAGRKAATITTDDTHRRLDQRSLMGHLGPLLLARVAAVGHSACDGRLCLMSGRGEYGVNMPAKRELAAALAAIAGGGGVLGAVVVWLNRPDPPSCTTLDNGMRACMPIYVVDPPLWLYGAFAVGGAFLVCGMTLAYAFARRAGRPVTGRPEQPA